MMRNVEIYFDDPFSKRPISDDNLKAYSALHIELLIMNGRFETIATKTKALHQGYFGPGNETTRAELTAQLTKNILAVALEVSDASDPEKAEAISLFPQHLLEPKKRFGIRGAETDLAVLNVMSPALAALPRSKNSAIATGIAEDSNEEESTSPLSS